MKINRQTLPLNKEVSFAEDIDFSDAKFDPSFLRKIISCHVEAKAYQNQEILRVIFAVKSQVVAISAYSLKDVPISLKLHDEIIFSDSPEDATAFYEPQNIVELDDHILGLILSHIPSKVVGKGEKLPSGGEGYRIISEDEYLKEKETKTDSRWEKLDSVKIE